MRSDTFARVSIVIEWENVRLSELDRCCTMLQRLGEHISQLNQPNHPTLAPGLTPFPADVEILVLFDPNCVEQSAVELLVREHLAAGLDACTLRIEPAPDLTYYEQKNLGAKKATGDIVIFLDSDVIPESGWLINLLSPFNSPDVQVVAGHSYLEIRTLYERAFALSWFFPLRIADARLETTTWFFANNVAFRRAVLERFPFPDLPGAARGSCAILARTLRNNHVAMVRNTAARVSHPPPNGFRHFVDRGIAHGRDSLVMALNSHKTHHASWIRSLGRCAALELRAIRNILLEHRQVGLSLLHTPIAVAIASTYYSLYLLGTVLTKLFPNYMQSRFQL